MATSCTATTEIYNFLEHPIEYKTAESLEEDVPRCAIPGEIYKSLSEEVQKHLLMSTYMSSRGNWASETIQRLCKTACVEDLQFLYGGDAPYLRWKLPIGTEDAYADASTYLHGYFLQISDMEKAVLGIDRIFEWSRNNIHTLAKDDFLGYYAYPDGIREAIEKPVSSHQPSVDRNVEKGEDGDGPWYLYSWIYSVKQVINTAQIVGQSVLHKTKVSAIDWAALGL